MRSWDLSHARCINLYPELAEGESGKAISALYGTPGLEVQYTLPTPGGCRGLYTLSNAPRTFTVSGQTLYELGESGEITARGTLLTSTGSVSMADNGVQLMLGDGPDGYILPLDTNVLVRITDTDFPGAVVVAFLDGYFVFPHPQTGQFGISALYNGLAYDAADFASAEASPDKILGMIVDHEDLWLFGTQSAQPFYNSGNADFPFSPFKGAFVEKGIAASFAVTKMDNSIFWLGQDKEGQGMVWRAAGYQPQRVSTHAVEYALGQETNLAPVTMWAYQQEGHSFVLMNLTDTTWVYDAATGLWHERQSLNPQTGTLGRWRAQWHAMAWGQHLVGDKDDGRIYRLNLDAYTEDGVALVAERTFPYVSGQGLRLTHTRLEVDMEVGVGLDGLIPPALGADPGVTLRWSDTHGKRWSNEHRRSLGRLGDYTNTLHWDRLGAAYDRLYQLRVTAPVKRAITGARLYPGGV